MTPAIALYIGCRATISQIVSEIYGPAPWSYLKANYIECVKLAPQILSN